jgi:hypothetical protein
MASGGSGRTSSTELEAQELEAQDLEVLVELDAQIQGALQSIVAEIVGAPPDSSAFEDARRKEAIELYNMVRDGWFLAPQEFVLLFLTYFIDPAGHVPIIQDRNLFPEEYITFLRVLFEMKSSTYNYPDGRLGDIKDMMDWFDTNVFRRTDESPEKTLADLKITANNFCLMVSALDGDKILSDKILRCRVIEGAADDPGAVPQLGKSRTELWVDASGVPSDTDSDEPLFGNLLNAEKALDVIDQDAVMNKQAKDEEGEGGAPVPSFTAPAAGEMGAPVKPAPTMKMAAASPGAAGEGVWDMIADNSPSASVTAGPSSEASSEGSDTGSESEYVDARGRWGAPPSTNSPIL